MAPRARNYAISRRAVGDLDDIFDYSAATWSVGRAESYLRDLYAVFEGLADGTRLGRDADLGDEIMKVRVNSHVVYYRDTAPRPLIIRVLHEAMDAARHLPGRSV